VNKQTLFSATRKYTFLILAIAPWAAACGEPSGSSSACTATGGALQSFATVDDVKVALTNKWEYCSGEPANFKEPTEFADDGHWYTLTRDSGGRLVRKGGFSNSGTYDINTQGAAPWNYVDIVLHYDSFGSTLQTNLAFLGSPLVMQNGPGIYVPIP
jgi:hypothetical protein